MGGKSIAQYEMAGKLGEGAMGQVYRARDTKLGREVAIKILRDGSARNAQAVSRFEREAKVLATLNHPHIAMIFGIEEVGNSKAIAMELVEGETLAERLRKGPLSVAECLRVFRQIASALEAAHDKGIIHRDLKPANIKFTHDGQVKVLDFGLAKPLEALKSEDDTQLTEATMPGAVLGTPTYMSPEQTRGDAVDQRTDVWAYGCCLYECLTGRKPFNARTISEMMAEVLRSDPDFTVIPSDTPGEVLTLLRRCLEKQPQRRLRDLRDIAITLEESSQSGRAAMAREGHGHLSKLEPEEVSKPKAMTKVLGSFGIVVLALGFAYAVFDLIFPRSESVLTSPSQIRSLAVLPFEASGDEGDLDAFALWVPDDLSVALQKLKVFERIPAWSLSRSFSNATPRLAAQQLGVQGLVQGRVRSDGNEISINLELIDGPSSSQLWADNFRTEDGDIEGLKLRMIEALLSEGLMQSISTEDRTRLGTIQKVNKDAYAAYRRGFDLYWTLAFDEAEAEFRRAIALDSEFVDPIVLLADAQWWPLTKQQTAMTPREGFDLAKKQLEKAIQLNPEHSGVLWQQGIIAMFGDWDWKNAQKFLRRSLEQNPENPDFYEGYATYKAFIEGDFDAARDLISRGLKLDPDNQALLFQQAHVLSGEGSYEKALTLRTRIDIRKPENWRNLEWKARCLIALERLTEAREEVDQAIRLSKEHPSMKLLLAQILAKSNDRAGATSILKSSEAQRTNIYVSPIELADVYAELGQWDSAFALLEEGYESGGDSDYVELRRHKRLMLMGDQPRYWDLIRKMKFPPLPIEHSFHEKEQAMRYGQIPE